MTLSKDLREFIESLNSHNAEYLVVGAYALAYHGSPRYTGDVDFFIRPSADNAQRLEGVLRAFGFGSLGLTAADFIDKFQVVQLGHPPNRIDLTTGLTGVSFDEAWQVREAAHLDGLPVHFIGRREFVKNKRATARLKHLADLEALGEA
jgi:hypothetical protein